MESIVISGPKLTAGHPSRKGKLTPRFWTRVIEGFLIAAAAAVVCSGVALDRISNRAYLELADKFSWMVLVKGDALQMDEVGGQLKQLPGARDVTLISPESAFQDLQNDPLYLGDTNAFEPSDLPASWRVRWDPRSVDFSLLPLFAEDVRRYPGVVEVAYDPRHLEMIHQLRIQHYGIQTGLWMSGLIFCLAVLVLMGRLLFFSGSWRLKPKSVALFLLADFAWWFVGLGAAWKFLNHAVPWPLIAGGLVVGVLHLCWNSLEKN